MGSGFGDTDERGRARVDCCVRLSPASLSHVPLLAPSHHVMMPLSRAGRSALSAQYSTLELTDGESSLMYRVAESLSRKQVAS